MSRKFQQSICHVNVNLNSMIENVTRIKSGTMRNVGVSAKIQKNIMHGENIIFGILLHVIVNAFYIFLITSHHLHGNISIYCFYLHLHL